MTRSTATTRDRHGHPFPGRNGGRPIAGRPQESVLAYPSQLPARTLGLEPVGESHG